MPQLYFASNAFKNILTVKYNNYFRLHVFIRKAHAMVISKQPAHEFEVRLNFLTTVERVDDWHGFFTGEYLQYVIAMLIHSGHYLFEAALLEKYNGKTLQEIRHANPCLIPQTLWPNPYQGGKEYTVYYDTLAHLSIVPGMLFYDRFFAYTLKHTDLLEVDALLEYQLSKHHHNNQRLFIRFLTLTMRKYQDEIIPRETVLTVHEWITAREQQLKEEQVGIQDKDKTNGKARIRRRPNDCETTLNQPQTVLLIHYLQKKGIILNNQRLTDADAGKAFEYLTGYSQHTIRHDLGKYYDFQNKENLRKVQQVLSNITMLIESQLNAKVSIP